MNIEKQLYKILSEHAKQNNEDGKVKGISYPTLWRMKEGKGNTTFSNVFKALFENGITEARLYGKNVEMIINSETNNIQVTTKSLSK